MTEAPPMLDIDAIRRLLPHRAPFLFVERMSDIVPFESANGWKAVGANEPWFQGHFPDFPVMPGVLVVEALAQTAGALVVHSLGQPAGSKVFFMTIDNARFRKPVRPGDTLRLSVKLLRRRDPVFKFEGRAFVGEALCAEAEYSAMFHSSDEKT